MRVPLVQYSFVFRRQWLGQDFRNPRFFSISLPRKRRSSRRGPRYPLQTRLHLDDSSGPGYSCRRSSGIDGPGLPRVVRELLRELTRDVHEIALQRHLASRATVWRRQIALVLHYFQFPLDHLAADEITEIELPKTAKTPGSVNQEFKSDISPQSK